MPAHITQRGSYFYLIDGAVRQSLHTNRKGLAQHKLEQYIRREFGVAAKTTLREYYQNWIELREKEESQGLLRKSAVRDYRQHFDCYILPEFGAVPFSDITILTLSSFRSKLLQSRSLKTTRNVIDSSFRALWRAVRKENLSRENPFELLEWPATSAPVPDPFDADERDRIIQWWEKNDYFYYPWVAVMFSTGMRPSEAAALRWSDVDLKTCRISIVKSRNLGKDAPPKTKHSGRTIGVAEEVGRLLQVLPSRGLGLEYVFVNKLGGPMSSNWAKQNWAQPLQQLVIRHRKFYATRHTFITEAIRAGEKALAVAQYCGTSMVMIQNDYCGTVILDRTILAQSAEKQLSFQLTHTGYTPVDGSVRMGDEVQRNPALKRLNDLKTAQMS